MSVARWMGLTLYVAVALSVVQESAFDSPMVSSAIASMMAVAILERGKVKVKADRVVFVTALIMSVPLVLITAYYGYLSRRPDLDPRIVDVREIKSITVVRTIRHDGKNDEFVAWPVTAVRGVLGRPEWDDDSVLGKRVLVALDDCDLIPIRPASIPLSERARLHAQLVATGYLGANVLGLRADTNLDGVIVEATSKSGQPLLFCAVQGGGLGGNRRPYCEFLFEGDARTLGPRLLSVRRFWFDVQGVEQPRRPILFVVFSCSAIVLAFPVGLSLIWAWRKFGRTSSPSDSSPALDVIPSTTTRETS